MVTWDMWTMNISYSQVKLIIMNGWKTKEDNVTVRKSRRYCKKTISAAFLIYKYKAYDL